MSVSLSPINDPDGDSIVDLSNGTWAQLTTAAAIPWNGLHDPQTYTPEQLRAVAKIIPDEWASFRWADGLEELAKSGGAILS